MRIAAFENQQIGSDWTHFFSEGSAPHRITLAGSDERGVPMFPTTADSPLCVGMRTLLLPAGGGFPGVTALLPWTATVIRASNLSDRYVVVDADVCRDAGFTRFYLLQYRSTRGVSGNVERHAGGTTLHRQPVWLAAPLTDEPTRTLSFVASTKVKSESYRGEWFGPFGFGRIWPFDGRSGTLFSAESDDDEASTLPRVVAEASSSGRYPRNAATFHLVDGRVALFPSEAPPPSAHFWSEGETIPIGMGFVVPRVYFYNFSPSFIYMQPSYVGPLGEIRRPGAFSFVTLFDEAGQSIAEGTDQLSINDFSHRLLLRSRNEGSYTIAGVPGTATVSARFGGNNAPGGDNSPPTLTALRLVDAAGTPVERLTRGAAARLLGSAIDYRYAMAIARPKAESLAVSYRRSGSGEWRPLRVVLRVEDYGIESEVGHAPDGTGFEADLREITSGAPGYYDLKLELEDEAGNSNETLLQPALFVGATRARPVRR